MSVLKTAVLRQIAYARSIRSIIRAIMRRMLDGEWINRIFASSDEEFNKRLDLALEPLDFATATKRDFCEAVVDVLCDEVSELCLALKEVCEGSGYSEYYESHISHERFVRLVLSVDTVKLGKMKKILDNANLSPIDILRNIGAVLNDETLEERAALGAMERRRANAELKAIAADVKSTMQIGFAQSNQKLLECKSEIIAAVGEKVDAVAAKVKRGSRRGRYTEAQIDFCGKVWESACDIQEIRNSTNTKVSYEAAFQFFRRQLAKLGVESVDDFKSIIRAHQARELRRRQREKSAAKPSAQRGKYGIMRDVKSHAKSALALTLAIAGGLVAPLRSEAAVRKVQTSLVPIHALLCAESRHCA